MSADQQNATLFSGDDLDINFAISGEDGSPLDLTGAVPEWILAQYAGGDAILTKTPQNSGLIVTDPAGGALSIALRHAETALLAGVYWHQLVITDASGDVTTVTTGSITIKVRTPL